MGLGGMCFDVGKTLVPDWRIGSLIIQQMHKYIIRRYN